MLRTLRRAALLLPMLVVSTAIATPVRADPPAGARVPSAALATPSPANVAPAAPSPVPQTRFTVRKKIERVEPSGWLRRFGEVEVRKHPR